VLSFEILVFYIDTVGRVQNFTACAAATAKIAVGTNNHISPSKKKFEMARKGSGRKKILQRAQDQGH